MAQDFGILITQPGNDVVGAAANKVAMNTSNPFIKIDTQNKAGFQTITLIITTDPPEPVGPATDRYTTLYKFKHGYTYTPSMESIFYVSGLPPGGTAATQLYFQDSGNNYFGGILRSNSIADGAFLYAVTDATWVYFICHKYLDSSFFGSANLLTGTNIQITTHVFVEDVGV